MTTAITDRPGASKRALVYPAALVAAAVLVFAAHFRPWEGGLLEEWALGRDWQVTGGWRVVLAYIEWTLSRPLHLLPTFLGLSLTNGHPSGIFAIMGLVAVGQFAGVVWALRPLSQPRWLAVAIALFVALHPLWPAGYIQRFLPAQTAVLALVIAAGLLIRWQLGGRVRVLVSASVVLILGFAVYPGPAAAAALLALVIAVAIPASRRRRIATVAATVASAALMAVYSVVIVRLITPDGSNSYELANIDAAAVTSVRELFSYVAGVFIGSGVLLLAAVVSVAVLGAVLSLTGLIPNWAGWLMAGVAFASPACALVFFGSSAWLQDLDRIGYTTSLGLLAALLVWPATATPVTRRALSRLQIGLVAGLAAVALVGGAVGISRWQGFVQTQHALLQALAPVVADAQGDESVVVIDRSATFGYLYTFPYQYLQGASYVENNDPSKVWLCFPDDERPLPSGGVRCDPSADGLDLRKEATLWLATGEVDIYVGVVDPDVFTEESQ